LLKEVKRSKPRLNSKNTKKNIIFSTHFDEFI
jgi:hypothetical protein